MATKKQLEANRKNAKKGGVKTPGGKELVKFNALKHGVLLQAVTEYEQPIYGDIQARLLKEYQPQTIIEEILVERIAMCYLRLQRAVKAETEFMKSQLDPQVVTVTSPLDRLALETTEVVNEGYRPIITSGNVAQLQNTYLRYETSIENRLYKAIHELERIQRRAGGDNVPAPVAIDVNLNTDKENS